jgi:Domain of unknown function (DUF4412)
MKKLITLLVLLTVGAQAQTFEGTIRWSMAMEFTDPAMKAQMEEAQKQMNDPEVQAGMKEMQEKMNDPEMKKMMEQNPQMKAAMEQAMKSMQGGGGMDNMMPKGMSLKIKGPNVVTLMEGGMVDGMEILNRDGQPAVRINRKDMTYSKLPDGQPGDTPEIVVTRGSESMKILGYTCQKYVVQLKTQGQVMNQTIWATSEIKDMNMKALALQRNAEGRPMFYDKVEGFPLKIEVPTPQGTMVMEVKEIKRGKLTDADFMIPAGFKEVK